MEKIGVDRDTLPPTVLLTDKFYFKNLKSVYSGSMPKMQARAWLSGPVWACWRRSVLLAFPRTVGLTNSHLLSDSVAFRTHSEAEQSEPRFQRKPRNRKFGVLAKSGSEATRKEKKHILPKCEVRELYGICSNESRLRFSGQYPAQLLEPRSPDRIFFSERFAH